MWRAVHLLAVAHAALTVGIGDQQPGAFSEQRLLGLGVSHARLVVPRDAATSEPATVQAWLDATSTCALGEDQQRGARRVMKGMNTHRLTAVLCTAAIGFAGAGTAIACTGGSGDSSGTYPGEQTTTTDTTSTTTTAASTASSRAKAREQARARARTRARAHRSS